LICDTKGAYQIATVSQPVRFRTFRDFYWVQRWVELQNLPGFGTLRLMSKPHESFADQFNSPLHPR
jgi:hypothetical protein